MGKCNSPRNITITNNSVTMKVELKVSKVSDVVSMAFCPRDTQNACGIAYRAQ